MRREDRRTTILHPETAAMLLSVLPAGGDVPNVNDPDICRYCRRHQCVGVCPTAALDSRMDSLLSIDAHRCVSCGACLSACYEFNNLSWSPRSGEAR